ncbi:MAG: carbon starvation protein A [Candidatus Omnitrophota bacterium]|nr:carbon starvation protein A [Candidatus Omnitrophota bacterium]
MNSLVFLSVSAGVLWLGYRFYGTAFEKFIGTDPKRATPAHTQHDGVDYVPAKHWLVLFGHHFSSIAGAGPVIGPIIAVGLWGWGPAVLFVLVGTIFIGGIHDAASLLLSIRYQGNSIADISEEMVSRRARLIFSWFVLLALVVVVSVFTYFCVDTFIVDPRVVIPSLGLIPAAVVVGILIYMLRINLALSTVIGLSLLAGLIFLGQSFPVILPKGYEALIWTLVLLVYCFFASVLPVNILLQPRDYLSSYLLFFGIAAGIFGVLTARPDFTTPAFTDYRTAEGPLWPMLFVTIACGAISGFHSLVAAGTTSKQISSERDVKRIGYGAMVVEALVAVVAIISVAGGFGGFSELKIALMKGGPVNVFGEGFGFLTRFILGKHGAFIAIILLNSFILTTLDTSTRIARYILQELFGTLDRYMATILIVLASGWIALTGEWKKIWPIFGAANQLVAALTLVVISSWLLSCGKHIKYTLVPAVFMLVTTVGALVWQLGKFVKSGDWFLAGIDAALLALAFAMIAEVHKWARRKLKRA